jgi:hypothetical protein
MLMMTMLLMMVMLMMMLPGYTPQAMLPLYVRNTLQESNGTSPGGDQSHEVMSLDTRYSHDLGRAINRFETQHERRARELAAQSSSHASSASSSSSSSSSAAADEAISPYRRAHVQLKTLASDNNSISNSNSSSSSSSSSSSALRDARGKTYKYENTNPCLPRLRIVKSREDSSTSSSSSSSSNNNISSNISTSNSNIIGGAGGEPRVARGSAGVTGPTGLADPAEEAQQRRALAAAARARERRRAVLDATGMSSSLVRLVFGRAQRTLNDYYYEDECE